MRVTTTLRAPDKGTVTAVLSIDDEGDVKHCGHLGTTYLAHALPLLTARYEAIVEDGGSWEEAEACRELARFIGGLTS